MLGGNSSTHCDLITLYVLSGGSSLSDGALQTGKAKINMSCSTYVVIKPNYITSPTV